MLFRLLKNELRHDWLTNLILCIFIITSSMLACTSISMIYSSQHQITAFMEEMGNVADDNFYMNHVTKEDITTLKEVLQEQDIHQYELNKGINLTAASISTKNHDHLDIIGGVGTAIPDTYNLLFDEQNEQVTLTKGNVGLPLSMKKKYDLQIGDSFMVTFNGHKLYYQIQCFVRDSLYGSDMSGVTRILFHEDDLDEMSVYASLDKQSIILSFEKSAQTENIEALLQTHGFHDYTLITKDTAHLSFAGVGMGTSALMMISGLGLIFMSFLIIRFTILFQIERNYTEIGIMKAIGFTHKQIKPLYISKYLGIAMLGCILGFLCSIPFTDFLEETQESVVPRLQSYTGTLLSSLVIVLIFLLVYIVTSVVLRKMKKQSTMDAIRKGNQGMSYRSISRISLRKCKNLKLPEFLAINDIISQGKHTLMMILIYTCCMMLVLVPVALKDCFYGNAFLQLLNLSIADAYTPQSAGSSFSELVAQRDQLQKELAVYDEDVQVGIEAMVAGSLIEADVAKTVVILQRADGFNDIVFTKGIAPEQANEVALSVTLADFYHKTVGDSISISYEGKSTPMVITGLYNSMMNLGQSAMLGDHTYSYAYNHYMVVHFSGNDEQRLDMTRRVKQQEQGMKLLDQQEMMKSFTGDMATQVGSMSSILIMVIYAIICCLTMLFSKLYIVRTQKEIALMQSFGYPKRRIQRALLGRVLIQTSIAVVLGVLLHITCMKAILEFYFEFIGMGGISLQLQPMHTFVIYPVCMIIIVGISQIIVNSTLHQWSIEELRED